MQFVGLDIGSKSIGIAVSDQGIMARSLKTIRFNSHEAGFNLLKQELEKLKPTIVVVGYPLHLDGTISYGCKIVDLYYKKLQDLNYQIYKQDERYTTSEAMDKLSYTFKSKSKQKDKKDAVSAIIILEKYWSLTRPNKENI